MESLFLPAHDAFIRWSAVGDGDPVAFLPGLSFPAVASFLAVATHPAMRRTCAVMIDYLGSGMSDHPTAPLRSLDDHADCVAAVIDHRGGGPCALVGHSMGGSVAIALARRRPDLVSRLVVGEANLTPGGGVATRRIAATDVDEFVVRAFPALLAGRRDAARRGDRRAAFIAGAWAHADPRALHANACALVGLPADFAEGFLSLPLPRAFLYGETSHPGATGAATPDAPDPAWLEARGVATAIVPGCGHELMLANPDGFVAALTAALRS